MNSTYCWSAIYLLLSCATRLAAQVTLSPNAARVVGHPQLTLATASPNLVEGRELNAPQGIGIDASANPPILYVSDTGNNRVLAWMNASQFANGAPADLVIGQKDRFTTFSQGPGTKFSVGLSSPTGLAVNNGNLYVVDSGNNRILRFPTPLSQTDQLPDLVVGQPNFTSNVANAGGTVSAKTIFLASGSTAYRASLAFDASGNLYLVDSGNRRVLRYPASALTPGNNGPAADLVLGQTDFISIGPALSPSTTANQLVKDKFDVPSGLALDPAGRLYISDSDPHRPDLLSRVLVFSPPFRTGMAASRVLGVVAQGRGQPPAAQGTIDRTVMLDPEGVLMIGNNPAVIDSLSSRILIFDPFEKWSLESPASPSPQALAVVGQPTGFSSRLANSGQPEPSQNALAFPFAAVTAGNELFVADTGNHRVLVFPQQSGSVWAATKVLGQNDFQFNTVNLIEGREFRFVAQTAKPAQADAGVAIDQKSDPPHLYVADTYNNRILGFKDFRTVRPGTRADLVIGQPDMLRSLCNYPNNDPDKPTQSSLCYPVGLAVDPDGNVWVADSANGRVLRFPNPFSQHTSLPPADLVLGQTSFTTKIADPTSRTMAAPYGLTLVADTGLLVSDEIHNRVLFFTKADGAFANGMAASKVVGQPDFSSSGASSRQNAEDNRLSGPHHIASDANGRLYVADLGNSRVLIFDEIANLPAGDAHPVAILQNQLRKPSGIYVNPQTSELWVADTGGNQCLRFPEFNSLLLNNFSPEVAIPSSAGPLALTQDQFGDLYVADSANRVAIYYPGLAALNAANFLVNRPLAPGVIASLYPVGNQFGPETKAFSDFPNPLPLPNELGDIQVLVNEQPAPLYFVSPAQINFLMPMSAPSGGSSELQVIRRSSGQVLGIGPVSMNVASPALFTASSTGNGQVTALNQDPDPACGKAPRCYVNSRTRPASRGSVISLYGTGQGFIQGAPPDGMPPQAPVATAQKPQVIIGTRFVDANDVQYSGLAPGLPGVWQINVRIPKFVAPGDSVIVAVVYDSIPSIDSRTIQTTIAVKE